MDAIRMVSMDLGVPTYMMSETSFLLKRACLRDGDRYVWLVSSQNNPSEDEATAAIPVAHPAPARPMSRV